MSTNPPRHGEVAAGTADGGVPHLVPSQTFKVAPLHHPTGGPPPRAGEDFVGK